MVEFDRTALKERKKLKNRNAMKKTERKLKRIGFALVNAELEAIKTADQLVKRVEEHAEEFEKIYVGDFR